MTGEKILEGVYLTEQDPEERAHEDGENAPVPLLVHATVPVGDLPVTLAVHVEEELSATGEGVQVTDVPAVDAKTEEDLGRMNRNAVVVATAKMNTARETSAHLHRPFLLNFDISDKLDARRFSFSDKQSQRWDKSPLRREFDHGSPCEGQRPKACRDGF